MFAGFDLSDPVRSDIDPLAGLKSKRRDSRGRFPKGGPGGPGRPRAMTYLVTDPDDPFFGLVFKGPTEGARPLERRRPPQEHWVDGFNEGRLHGQEDGRLCGIREVLESFVGWRRPAGRSSECLGSVIAAVAQAERELFILRGGVIAFLPEQWQVSQIDAQVNPPIFTVL